MFQRPQSWALSFAKPMVSKIDVCVCLWGQTSFSVWYQSEPPPLSSAEGPSYAIWSFRAWLSHHFLLGPLSSVQPFPHALPWTASPVCSWVSKAEAEEGMKQFGFLTDSSWVFFGTGMVGFYFWVVPEYRRINLAQRHAFPWLWQFQKQVAHWARIPSVFSHPIFKARWF